jgi:hypothetical protein
MKPNFKYLAYGAMVGLLVGGFLGKSQQKVQTKEVVKYVDKIVEKRVQSKDTDVVVVEKRLKDGTVEKRTEVKEHTNSVTDTKEEKSIDSISSKTSVKGSGVTLGVLGITDLNLSHKLEYGLTVTVPVAGAVKVQALGTTDKKVGLGVAIEF